MINVDDYPASMASTPQEEQEQVGVGALPAPVGLVEIVAHAGLVGWRRQYRGGGGAFISDDGP